jgi:hypothetical protein
MHYQAVEDGVEEVFDDVKDFEVMLVDGHLKIQADELAQVAMRPRVFGPAANSRSRESFDAMHIPDWLC